jgi:hypothetical protein
MVINDTAGLGPIEGDPAGWHIRLTRKAGDVETWALWYGEERQSSNWPKDTVQEWMRYELEKA